MQSSVYNTKGESAGKQVLPEGLFGQEERIDLLHRVVTAARANARQLIAHTKNRSDRRGSGRKPWRQKGTGRARHGSVRSPIWRGGGVIFGPSNERNYKQKVSKAEKRQAVASALSGKRGDNQVLLVDSLSFEKPSARQAREILTQLSTVKGFAELEDRRNNAALIVIPERDENVDLSFRNFGNVAVCEAKDVSALDLLTYKFVIITNPEASFKVLEGRLTKSK